MLTLKMLRDDPEFVIRKLAVKNFDAREIVERLLDIDTRRRALQTENDALVAQQKVKAGEIGGYMKQGLKDKAEEITSCRYRHDVHGKSKSISRAVWSGRRLL